MLIDSTPGAHELTADLPDVPGACRISVQADINKVSYFRIAHRSDSLGAGLFLGFLGQALESAGKQCGGAYALAPVEPEVGAAEVQRLRLSGN